MKDRKKLQENELKDVNSGFAPLFEAAECPKCKSRDVTVEHRGSGCGAKTWGHCKKCGNEWQL